MASLVKDIVTRATPLRHYNAAVQVFDHGDGSRVVWTVDLLPDDAAAFVAPMMDQGLAVMRQTLDALVNRGG